MIHIIVPMVPPSPNVTKRKAFNPWKYARLRSEWEKELFYGVPLRHRNALINQAREGHRMKVDVALFHPRTFDDDNAAAALKPVLDALKKLGYLQDDAPAFLELVLPVKQFKTKEARTVIKIGPVDAE